MSTAYLLKFNGDNKLVLNFAILLGLTTATQILYVAIYSLSFFSGLT